MAGKGGEPSLEPRLASTASTAHLASGFSAAESREIKAGGRTSSNTRSPPFLTQRLHRRFQLLRRGREYLGVRTSFAALELTVRPLSRLLLVLLLNTLKLFLASTLLLVSVYSPAGEKEGRRGRKEREAADSKRRINVQLVLRAKSREGTRRGSGEEGAAH